MTKQAGTASSLLALHRQVPARYHRLARVTSSTVRLPTLTWELIASVVELIVIPQLVFTASQPLAVVHQDHLYRVQHRMQKL